jgi:hypothetical protein
LFIGIFLHVCGFKSAFENSSAVSKHEDNFEASPFNGFPDEPGRWWLGLMLGAIVDEIDSSVVKETLLNFDERDVTFT